MSLGHFAFDTFSLITTPIVLIQLCFLSILANFVDKQENLMTVILPSRRRTFSRNCYLMIQQKLLALIEKIAAWRNKKTFKKSCLVQVLLLLFMDSFMWLTQVTNFNDKSFMILILRSKGSFIGITWQMNTAF